MIPLPIAEGDPRRDSGYRGPLLVDNCGPGPYAVCQNDLVGRVDSTGEFSFLFLLSDFTWSMQNNVAGLFGLELVLNF